MFVYLCVKKKSNYFLVFSRDPQTDFREIAGGALNTLLKQDALQGNAVLQLVKVRNCSAPKSNEESKSAPRLLRVHLTDGQSQCQAVEMENIQALTLNLPPGTKVRMNTFLTQFLYIRN